MGIPFNQGDNLVPEGGSKNLNDIFDAQGHLVYTVEINPKTNKGEWVKVKKQLDEVQKYAKDNPLEQEIDLDSDKAVKAAEDYARRMQQIGKKVGAELNNNITKPIQEKSSKAAASAGAAAGKEYALNFNKEASKETGRLNGYSSPSYRKSGTKPDAAEVKAIKDASVDTIRPAVEGVIKSVRSQIGTQMGEIFKTPEIIQSLQELGNLITKTLGKAIEDAFDPKRYSLEGHPLEKQIKNIIGDVDKQLAQPLRELFNLDKITADKVSSFLKEGGVAEFAEGVKGMASEIKESVAAISGLSKNDKKMLGLVNQDKLVVSDRASNTLVNQYKKAEQYKQKLIDQQVLLAKAREDEARSNIALNDYQMKADERNQAKELKKERKDQEEARRKRAQRMALFKLNTQSAVEMAGESLLNNPDAEDRKRMNDYYRSVQRIAGIYQSAVVHGRVENPQTIFAGISELQQRSSAITERNLAKQIGIDELNEKLKTTQQRTDKIFSSLNRAASVIENFNNAFATIRNVTNQITNSITRFARTVLSRVASQIKSITQDAISAYQSLQTSMIGFSHFFGEDTTKQLTQQIKSIAAKAPGLDTAGLAEYVRQLAPVSGGNADLALNASLGMLKTIQYGGANGATEMEYVIKNVRDVLAKGKATQIDLRQFNRAMPVLEKVLSDIGESSLIKDGKLNITEDNVDTILSAFARLNTAQNSPVAGIYDEINKTLGGQWEQLTEQLRTNVMEMFEDSGVFGGIVNLLRQFNAGEYAQTGLARLGKVIKNFVENIDWFEVQRVATEMWNSLKIIAEGVKDAIDTIRQAIGGDATSVAKSFAGWIADIIRGIGDGIAQVIRFVKYVESTGIMNNLSRIIGWLGSAGATLFNAFSQFTMNMMKMIGNAGQFYTRLQTLRLQNQIKSAQETIDAIPAHLKTTTVTQAEILNGKGLASPAYSVEASAIDNLSKIVNQHFNEVETLVAKNTAAVKGEEMIPEASWLPETSIGKNRAGETVSHIVNSKISPETGKLSRIHSIGVYNSKTGEWDYKHFNSGNVNYDNKFADAYYTNLLDQNKLQRSGNKTLNAIGSSQVYKKIESSIDSIKNKVTPYIQKTMSAAFKGGIALTFTEVITAAVYSLNMFGEDTAKVAAIIKAAGLTITGAIMGSTVGGIAGGVVGALAGLGIGIVQLVDTIRDERDKLTNTNFTKALTESQQNILDAVEEGLIKGGYLAKDTTARSDEESYALQQVANTISTTGTEELQKKLEQDQNYLYRVYADALTYKTIGMNSTGQNTGEGFDWNNYKASSGKGVNIQNDRETMSRMAKLISKYDLAADQGWYRDTNGNYYNDENFTNAVSGEEIWKAYFGDQDITKQGVDAFEKYLAEQEKKYAPLKDVGTKTEEIKGEITKLTGNTPQTYLDTTTGKIYDETKKANNTLLEIAGQNPTDVTNAGLWGRNDTEKSQITTMGDKWNDIKGDWGFFWSQGAYTDFKNGKIDSTSTNYDLNFIFDRVNKLLKGDAGVSLNEAQTKELETFRSDMLNRNYANDSPRDIRAWIDYWRKRLKDAGLKYQQIGFAAGGSVLSRGIDTIPAMLAPGEFVMKPSAVKKSGLGVLHALNHGDLGYAARLLAGNVSNNWYKNNNANINNSRNNNTNINNIVVNNHNASARLNSYYSLANRLSF